MSDLHSHHAHGKPELPSSHTGADMNLGKIMVVGAASLALFAVGIVWSYRIMVVGERESNAAGVARIPTEIGKPEIGIVDQVPFAIDTRLEVWRAQNHKHLSTYGWVDRAKGLAHIPIEKAMEQVVASPPDIPGESVPPAARAPVLPPPPAASPAATKSGGSP